MIEGLFYTGDKLALRVTRVMFEVTPTKANGTQPPHRHRPRA